MMYILDAEEQAQIINDGPRLLVENKLLLKVVSAYMSQHENFSKGNNEIEHAQNIIKILSKYF